MWPKNEHFSFSVFFLLATEQHIYLLISLLLKHAIVEFMRNRNNNGIDDIANRIRIRMWNSWIYRGLESLSSCVLYLLQCFPLDGAYDGHINLVKRVRKSNHRFIWNAFALHTDKYALFITFIFFERQDKTRQEDGRSVGRFRDLINGRMQPILSESKLREIIIILK